MISYITVVVATLEQEGTRHDRIPTITTEQQSKLSYSKTIPHVQALVEQNKPRSSLLQITTNRTSFES